ncbi:MAG: hypothetical protein NVSMB52_21140 [Chloroflexota bacterium]
MSVHALRTLIANRWVRYSLTLALIALVIGRVQPARLLGAVGSARPLFLAAALFLTGPFLYFKALRWHLMLRHASIQASFREAIVSLVGGMGLALVTPARMGELVRVAYLRDPQKMRIGGLVLIDKGFDVLVLLVLSVPGAWILLGKPVAALLGCVAVVGLLFVTEAHTTSEFMRHRVERLPLGQKLAHAVGATESLTRKRTAAYLLITLVSFAIVLVQFALILASWLPWSVEAVFLTFPLVILTNVLPFTIGGLGVREGTAAVLLAHYGVSNSHAVLGAFLMFAMNTALPGLIGVVFLPATAGAPRTSQLASPH